MTKFFATQWYRCIYNVVVVISSFKNDLHSLAVVRCR